MINLYTATRHELFNSFEDKKTEKVIPGTFFRYLSTVLLICLYFFSNSIFAQVSSCEANVPYYNVNLVGKPSGVWISPSHQRLGHCCGSTGSEECTSFDVTLDPLAVALSLNIESGAIPSGSLYYQVNCGPMTPVGQAICVSGAGPHHITFCKPGNNENTYSITSIQQPSGPTDKTIRKVCSATLSTAGLKSGTVTWTSIYPGTGGQYNSNLSCTSCMSPVFTPFANSPDYIIYKVCGWPIADKCGYGNYFCDTVKIQMLPQIAGVVNPSPAYLCSSEPFVTLSVTPSGGTGSYTYKWINSQGSTVSTSAAYNATVAGTYSVQINDGLSSSTCPGATVSINVISSPASIANAGPDQILCATDSVIFLSGTSSTNSGIWSGGSGTFGNSSNLLTTYNASPAEINAGSVSLTLTTTGAQPGCSNKSDQVLIKWKPKFVITFNNTVINCFGNSTNLSAAVSGGSPGYTYSWNSGETASSITAQSGSHCITVRDQMGCVMSKCITLSEPSPLSINISKTDLTVMNVNDGTATANLSGGTSPYSYLWSNGQTGSSISGLSPGQYSVTVTDSRGCQIIGNVFISQPGCNYFSISISGTGALCNGSSNGQANAIPTGGTSPFTYQWSNGQNGDTATGLAQGYYTLTATDSKGCQSSSGVTITEPEPLDVTAAFSNNNDYGVNCNGNSDAWINLNIQGGTPQYNVQWTGPSGFNSNAAGISNIPAGTYNVSINDNNNCSLSRSFTVTEPLPIEGISGTSNNNGYNVSCNGSSDAFINIDIQGGSPQYSVLWSGPNGFTSSSPNISNLAAGIYGVSVKDKNNCSFSKSFTITEPPLFNDSTAISSNSGYNVSCNGDNDAFINLSINGGTPQYDVQWTGPNGFSSTALNISSLSVGTYYVTVKDANNCSISKNFDISEPAPLNEDATISDNNGAAISCSGAADAFIDLTVQGGASPYSFQWSGPSGFNSNASAISNIGAGNYSVIIKDKNNCTLSKTFYISQPDPLDGVSTTSDNNGYNISCSGKSDAFINISPQGGMPQYSFSWTGPSGFTSISASISNIAAGNYNVNITDKNNCSVSKSFTITEPVPLDGIVSTSDNNGYSISCSGKSDAFINIAVQGGMPQYSIAWTGPSGFTSSSSNISNLSAGNYNVIITDKNNCSYSNTFNISEPPPFDDSTAISSNSGYAVSCNGNNDGFINLTVQGGTPQYNVQWMGPNGYVSSSMNINNLSAGDYSVTVQDANNCSINKTFNVTQPEPLNAGDAISNYNGSGVSCSGAKDASIALSVEGGAPQYNFQWSGPNGFSATSAAISSLEAGIYNVTVIDKNNCSFSKTYTITEPVPLDGITTSSDNNGYSVSCYGKNDASLSINVQGGTPQYSILWTGPNGFNSTLTNISNLAAGSYSVSVTDANSCLTTKTFQVTQPDSISTNVQPSSFNGNNISCNGSNDGAINVSLTGGVAPFTYSWSGNNGFTASGNSINNLAAGIYVLSVSDKNGCTSNGTTTITEPPALLLSGNTSDILCNGGADGKIITSVSGGTSPYSFNWRGPSNFQSSSNDITGINGGSYQLSLTDINGCIISKTFQVAEPAGLNAASTVTNVSCFGGTNGAIDLNISGGVQGYNVTWNNSATGNSITNISSGTYQYTITDLNGCNLAGTATVNEPPDLQFLSKINDASCTGIANGEIKTNIIGGVSPYKYLWSNGSITSDITGLSSGQYHLTVTDDNSCKKEMDFTISDAYQVNGDIISSNCKCNGDSEGIAAISILAGTAPYSYNWSNGAASSSVKDLPEGTYSVTVRDSNGCTFNKSIVITQPEKVKLEVSSPLFGSEYNLSGYKSDDGSITANVSGGVSPYIFHWSNDLTSEQVNNLPAGTYDVTCTDANGCQRTASITLTQPKALGLPTGFSPNGDGKNDYFVVLGLELYPANLLTIFNRWGNEVYSQENYKNDWNGTNNKGEPLPDATYFVILKLYNTDITLTGYVDMRR